MYQIFIERVFENLKIAISLDYTNSDFEKNCHFSYINGTGGKIDQEENGNKNNNSNSSNNGNNGNNGQISATRASGLAQGRHPVPRHLLW